MVLLGRAYRVSGSLVLERLDIDVTIDREELPGVKGFLGGAWRHMGKCF